MRILSLYFLYLKIEKDLLLNNYSDFKLQYEINFFIRPCIICFQRRFYKIKVYCCNQHLCENCAKKLDKCPFCRASLI